MTPFQRNFVTIFGAVCAAVVVCYAFSNEISDAIDSTIDIGAQLFWGLVLPTLLIFLVVRYGFKKIAGKKK